MKTDKFGIPHSRCNKCKKTVVMWNIESTGCYLCKKEKTKEQELDMEPLLKKAKIGLVVTSILLIGFVALMTSCAGPSAYRAARDAGMSKWQSFLWSIPPR